MRLRRTARLAATLIGLSALVATPAQADSGPHQLPEASIPAGFQTPVVYDDDAGGHANADDPAVWVHPTDRGKSLVVLTLKEGGLAVYDLRGTEVQRIAAPARPRPEAEPGRFNNVDIIYGFQLHGRSVDLAMVSDRGRDRIRSYAFDPTAAVTGRPPLTDVTSPNAPRVFSATENAVDEAHTAYGLASYTDGGKSYVVVSRRHETQLALLRLVEDHGQVTYRTQDTVDLPAAFLLPNGKRWTPCLEPGERPQVEGMAVDQTERVLYAGQEDVGMWRIALDEGRFTTPRLMDRVREYGVPAAFDPATEECVAGADPGFGGTHLSADVEGITIYHGKDGTGYILASSQGDSTFALYDRKNNLFLDSFAVTDGPRSDGAEHCDGATVVNTDLGWDFPRGILVVQDGRATPANEGREATNAKFVPWESLATAFPKSLMIDTTSFDPRHP